MSSDVYELNEKNFNEKIKKGRWIVDFWAVWCVAPNSIIHTSTLNSKQANEINITDKILSSNGNITKDNVIYSNLTNMGGHCKKIITSTGRYLETTDDHAFFTKRGWIKAQELTNKDKVAILPLPDYIISDEDDKTILKENDFGFLKKNYKNLDKYLEELRLKKLLPLKLNEQKLLILSRLIGALFSDGSLYNSRKNNYREISFSLGQNHDVDEIINDLNILGFNTLHISKRNNENEIDGGKFLTHTFKVKCLSTALYLLFRVLGVPEGNKTNQPYFIPDWIKKGNLAIKKEFLSGYLGGDGPRISMEVLPRMGKMPYNSININDIEFRKRSDIVDSGIKLANEIADLLKESGIKMGKIFHEIDPYIRKDNKNSAIIHIPIASNFSNGFIMSQKIGYAYCWQKQLISMYAGEFIREILKKREEWLKLYNKIMKLSEKGLNYQKISETLNIDKQLAYQWIIMKNKPTINKHYLKFDQWIKEAREGLNDGFIWEKVEEITSVNLPEVQIITTENHHNFVANGFLVHNCGPCKIMAPHFDAAAKEMKEKFNFGKVNVDENFEIAERFGVMSIPTTIIFKDGEIIDQKTGAMTSKEEILKFISNNF